MVAADEQVTIADTQVSEAYRLWAPTGGINAAFTGSPKVRCADALGYSSPDQTVRENNCVTTTGVDLQNSGSSITNLLPLHGIALNISANLVQPLYSFGKIEAAIDAAHAGRKVAGGQREVTRAELVMQAVRAYWGLKWARASGATLDDGLARIKGWVDKIDREMDAGKSSYSETDLIRLKLALDQTKLARYDIARAERIALAGIRTLTADDKADIDDGEIDETELGAQTLEFYEEAAQTHRPEVRMLDGAVAAAHAAHRLSVAQLLPNVGLLTTFSYGYAQSVDTPNNGFMNHPDTLGAGLYLVVQQPLDFIGKLGTMYEANARERLVAAKRREALGGVGLEITRAYADAEEARQRATTTAHGEKVARGWYSAVDQNMDLGTAEARDMVDAARTYFELRLKHLQSIMDSNIAAVALRRTAGLDPLH